MITKHFKINNPFRPDQKISQEVIVGDELTLDYKNCKWIAIDTEFLSLNSAVDRLCTIQIASKIEENDIIRVEILHVFDKKPDKKFLELIANEKILKILHYSLADLPRIEKFTKSKIKGDIFDTHIASKITLTNLDSHSLESLIQYLVDPEFNKTKKVTSSEWDLDPDLWEEEQFEYAAKDVLYLFAIMQKILKIAERRNKTEILNKTMKILPTLSDLINQGYEPKNIIY